MTVEQRIKSKTSQTITSENKAVVMLDHSGNRSNAFGMKIAEKMFEFRHTLPIPASINTSSWNCYLGNMANVLYLIGDTKCDNFFSISMDKHWS